ncbi:MAG: carboxypeptidase regulatory-like domain-containing protein [Bacteroidota bacterium]|jgi:hypothetical protein
MLKRILFLFTLVFVAGQLFAQITTSAINGAVKSTADEPLVGATIVATHQPSGTKYTTITRAGGQFSIQNMRVGGPYLIEISYVGHNTERVDNIFLQLAESFLLNPSLEKTSTTMTGVTITGGRKNAILNSGRTGALTNIGVRQINQLPTISRSLNDITRVTPQANGASIGGGNSRQNNFTVDGADFNNSFGIGSNLPAGGSPISLDAVEELSVNITPFDIRQTGFIGSAINAVTRSGTNTFSGSVYTYFRNENQRGNRVEKTFFNRNPEEFKQYGFRIGGPIIKDKLFFFFNYETETSPKQIQNNIAATAGATFGSSPNIARPTADSLNFIRQYLLTNYGYETGPFDNYTPSIERTKYLARIDWNINQRHKFNIRYSQVEGGEPFTPSPSTTGAGFNYASGLGRTNINNLWYKNSNYFQGANLYSIAAELNSNWGKVSNTLRGTFTYQNDSRTSESQVFPFVDILSTSGVASPAPYTSFGYEPFSFGNIRKVKTYSIIDYVTWTKNKHNWTVGGQFDYNETINGFQRFATSYYVFNSWADFASALNPNPALRAKPRDFALTYSLSPGFAPALSSFRFAQYSVYGQDEIAVNKKLRITLGLRLDLPTYPFAPQIITHPLVANASFVGGEKFNTGILPKKRIMWSPRFGFNWDLYGDRSLQIRGGTGIFTGRIPFVWIVSQSGDNGMLQITQAFNGQANTPGPFNPNPTAYRPATVPQAGTIIPTQMTALDPEFQNPQSWKSSLAIDTKMPGGIIATVEAIFNKDLVTSYFRNINLLPPVALNIVGYPDNRPIYGANTVARSVYTLNNAGAFNTSSSPTQINQFNPVVLDNAARGYYFSLTTKLEKTFSKGLYASIAYTKSFAANLFDGGGDQPLSAWQGTASVAGSNYQNLSYADYVIPDRVVGILTYRKEYFKHLATSISLYYNGGINGRFSYTYGGGTSTSIPFGGDFNRDGVNGNDLIYIPTAAEVQLMSFASHTQNGVVYNESAQRALFEAYILQDKYLRSRRGQYAERNGAQLPWLNRVDLKFAQDIFTSAGKNKNTLQFTIDIFNFGNLLNPSWGKLKSINASGILLPQNTHLLVPGGTVPPQFKLATAQGEMITRTFRDNVSIFSTYSMQFGLRYIFN